VLISAATGAAKSTFGMSVTLNQGIIRCISTDKLVSERFFEVCDYGNSFPPVLHRSSYSGQEDPIQQWKECCEVLQPSMDGLIEDAMMRGVSSSAYPAFVCQSVVGKVLIIYIIIIHACRCCIMMIMTMVVIQILLLFMGFFLLDHQNTSHSLTTFRTLVKKVALLHITLVNQEKQQQYLGWFVECYPKRR